MRAVFDAGHAPFVPHLLFPQVLSESETDLRMSFAANYAFLGVCDEIWIFARELADCSSGMAREVAWTIDQNRHRGNYLDDGAKTVIRYVPQEFEKIFEAAQQYPIVDRGQRCRMCQEAYETVDSLGRCVACMLEKEPK
jgi:hypothetical protein